MQETSDNNEQERMLSNVVLILLGQYYTDKTLDNFAQEASDTITQEKILILLGQYYTSTYSM